MATPYSWGLYLSSKITVLSSTYPLRIAASTEKQSTLPESKAAFISGYVPYSENLSSIPKLSASFNKESLVVELWETPIVFPSKSFKVLYPSLLIVQHHQ